jgi:uncharacterized protein
MSHPAVLFGIGILVGVYSGIMGLGGGTIMIPILVLALGFTQHEAVGTSLAVMIPPVTLPAVIQYYREGQAKLGVAGWIALGFLPAVFFGAYLTQYFTDWLLKLVFGFVLVYIAGYTIFGTLGKQHLVRTISFAGVLLLVAAIFFGATWWYDSRTTPQSPATSATAAE